MHACITPLPGQRADALCPEQRWMGAGPRVVAGAGLNRITGPVLGAGLGQASAVAEEAG
jgi:hypothetical protein